MPRMMGLLLALLVADGAGGAGGAGLQPPAASTIELEIRVFDGSDDVTADTRVAVFKAGERETPLARLPLKGGRKTLDVPEGFYDVQAVREHNGRVLTIRWAERLVVMRYPDEGGRHLEVINLRPGYGALQIRAKDGGLVPPIAIFADGRRTDDAAAQPLTGHGYALFVVPAGRYDLRVGPPEQPAWHPGIDVPRDRTRLWVVPPAADHTTDRPRTTRAITTTSAMTSRMWITPPAISKTRPSSHRNSSTTTMVHSIGQSSPAVEAASGLVQGGYQA